MVRKHLFDLVVILLPFLRVVRAARGLRLLRSLSRIVVALSGTASLGRAFASARRIARQHGDRYVLLLVSLATVAGAAIILSVERDAPDSNIRTFGDAFWWAVSTVTAVGHVDRYPTTGEGRSVALLLMVLTLALFSVVTARVATFFIVDEERGDDVSRRLERIEALLIERTNGRSSVSSVTEESIAELVSKENR
jgi:voltage-gated potassium channel